MRRRMRTLVTEHRLAMGVVALLLVGGVLLALVLTRPDAPPEPVTGDEEPQPEATARWPLSGVETTEETDRPTLVVKVSNSPEARPQTGLEAADVVFEELTEGGMTRFAAVFHSQLPDVVGPVRSARPIDVQLVAGFGRPAFAYSGARDEVREMLARSPAITLTEGAAGFFRDAGTYASHPVAPHNLFVRPAETMEAARERGAGPPRDQGWTFLDQLPPTTAPDTTDGTSVDIVMSPAMTTTWVHDPGTGLYRRQQNNTPTALTGSGRIGAANVVVLEARHYVGASGYPETELRGEGPALLLRDGVRLAARWSKPDDAAPLRLLTEDGAEPLPLRPGPTWIHLPAELPGHASTP